MIVGRQRERARLQALVGALQRGEAPGVVVVKGRAGLGKSVLVSAFLEGARAAGVTVLHGAGDPVHRAPYHPWRTVVAGLAQHLDALEPELRRWAPVLGAMGVDLPDTEATAHMHGEARHYAVRRVVVGLLRAAPPPLAMVIDDGHWVDASSWELVAAVVDEVPRIAVVLASRGDVPVDAEVLELAPMPAADVLALVAERLGVDAVPTAVAGALEASASGHPLMGTELALGLRDAGVLAVHGRTARVTADFSALPASVEEAITGRLARLDRPARRALEVASVVGTAFPVAAVAAAEPTDPAVLDDLAARDLVVRGDAACAFKHVLIRDAAYAGIEPGRRAALHGAVARWWEAAGGEATVLAHHWEHAGEAARAVVYLEQAAREALREFANAEAARLVRHALALEPRAVAVRGPDLARAKRLAVLAEAEWKQGRYDACLDRVGDALGALNRWFPRSSAGVAVRLAVEGIAQVAHRLAPSARPPDPARAEAASTLFWATKAYFIQNALPPYLLSNLAMLNLADRGGPSRELADASAVMGLTAGLMGMHGIAETYAARAIAAARALDSPVAVASVLMVRGVYLGGMGRWQALLEACGEGARTAERLGDRRAWKEHQALQCLAWAHTGDLERAARGWAAVLDAARRDGDPQVELWGLCGPAECAMRGHGELRGTLDGLRQAAAIAPGLGIEDEIRVHGLRAWVHAALGEWAAARSAADTASERIGRHSRPNSFWSYDGYAGAAACWLALSERAVAEGRADGDAHRAQSVRAVRALRAWSKVFPMGAPRAALHQAVLSRVNGRAGRARGRLVRAGSGAATLGLPWEASLVAAEQAGEGGMR